MQTDDGNVLLIDDGNTRPNCTAVGSDTNCFSRALEYELAFGPSRLACASRDPAFLPSAQVRAQLEIDEGKSGVGV